MDLKPYEIHLTDSPKSSLCWIIKCRRLTGNNLPGSSWWVDALRVMLESLI